MLLDLGTRKDGLEVLGSIRAKDNPVPRSSSPHATALKTGCAAWTVGPMTMCSNLSRMAELLAHMRAGAAPARSGSARRCSTMAWCRSTRPRARRWSTCGTAVQLSGREFSLLQALLVQWARCCRAVIWKTACMSRARLKATPSSLIHALRHKRLADHKNVRGRMDGFKKQLNASIQRKLSFSVSLTIVVVALLAGLLQLIAAFNEAQSCKTTRW